MAKQSSLANLREDNIAAKKNLILIIETKLHLVGFEGLISPSFVRKKRIISKYTLKANRFSNRSMKCVIEEIKGNYRHTIFVSF